MTSSVRIVKLFCVVFLSLFSIVLSGAGNGITKKAHGGMFYVSPTGNNSNPGTKEKPWASPGYASRQLKPGDILTILDGRYILKQYDDDIITPPSGRSDAWITIRGESGKRPILAGRNNLANAITLSGANYIRIENLEITHDVQASGSGVFFRDGIIIMGQPANNIILNTLYIHHIDEFGLNFQDISNLQVNNCRIEYTGFGAIGGPTGETGGWRNARIRNCQLSYSGHYYRGDDGSTRPYDRPDGFGIEASNGPVKIVNTLAEHNYGDGLA